MHLNKEHLKKLIDDKQLVTNYIDLERQLTPNGIDLTAEKIERFKEKGQLDFSNKNRVIPDTEEVKTRDGWWHLDKGVYKLTANEVVDIPKNLVGYGFPRSSLMRMGCYIENGFWEAGYHGKTVCLLVVGNKDGVDIEKDARVLQIAFKEIEGVKEGYRGNYGFEK